MSLYPAKTILRSKAFDLEIEYAKKQNPTDNDLKSLNYALESIEEALKILECSNACL